MSSRNNLPNYHGTNGDYVDGSSDEAEQNPTTTGSIYIVDVSIIFPEQLTPPSQPVTDERTIDPQDLTSTQDIDRLIEYQPDNLGAIIPTLYWFIFMLFSLLVCQYWPLLLLTFVFVAYQLITYNNQLEMDSRESQSLYSNLVSPYAYDPNRDAEAEGRTAQPTETIRFSDTTELVLDHVPFDTPNTQLHDTAVPVGLNNTRQTDVIANIENGNINGPEIITTNTQNETNVPMTTDEHILETNVPMTTDEHIVSQTAVDNPGCNINALRSVEPQDDHHSSDSSDGEDLIMSSGSGFDSDDEYDSADDNEQTGRALPVIENLPNSIQNNRPSNQTNTVNEQPAASVPLHNEAAEIKPVVAIPADGAQPVIISRIRSKRILIPKSRNLVRPNSESSDEHIA